MLRGLRMTQFLYPYINSSGVCFKGEANKQEWKDWCRAEDEMDALSLYCQVTEIGERLEIWCFCIKEFDGAYTFYGSFK